MNFDKDQYTNTSINTLRDDDGNLMSVTSSMHSFFEDDQFIELKNTNYRNSKTNLINYNFEEYNLAEQTTAERIIDFFNTYNDIKDNIKITGNTNSHEYLFNSSKTYLNKQNLIVVNETEYSNTLVNNKNLIDDLRVKDEINAAELESANKELTALYETVTSIKDGVIGIIDSTIIPAVENNIQLKYAMLSLKAIAGQTIDYLIQNKADLKISKKSINNYDIKKSNNGTTTRILNNTITYNYLSNPSYFNNIFNDLLKNPNYLDNVDLINDKNSKINSLIKENEGLKADKIKLEGTVQQLNNKIDSLNSIIIALGGDPSSGGSGSSGSSGGGGTGDDDSSTKQLITEYNMMYDRMMTYVNKYITDSRQVWDGSILSSETLNQYQTINNNTLSFLDSLTDEYTGTPYDSKYSEVLKLSKEFVNKMILFFVDAIKTTSKLKSNINKLYFKGFGEAIYKESFGYYKPQLEQYGRL